MTLYNIVHGQGPSVVLLHGWGLHGGVWNDVTSALSAHGRIIVPDFPGHGRSREFVPRAYTSAIFAEEIKRLLAGPAVWVGWSLGALVTISAAQLFPDFVTKIALVGATPKFARTADWPYATRSEVLNQFAHDLENDYVPTLTRFLSLQVSKEDDRTVLRQLRETLFRYGEPSATALLAGLKLLMEEDHRLAIPTIDVPTLIIHGERDQLVPVGAARFMATQMKQARIEIFPRAGHAPFLTHNSLFVERLKDFIHD